ncbi:hypothetical protein VNO77_15673 [Canavalia gladiata]|uniref:J domain-containing protein n=1 Tax=Canavalia gladiata TaxID=3824 RepID=A0AAN9M2X1_CANGL
MAMEPLRVFEHEKKIVLISISYNHSYAITVHDVTDKEGNEIAKAVAWEKSFIQLNLHNLSFRLGFFVPRHGNACWDILASRFSVNLKMNSVTKGTFIRLFHSTPLLERKSRSFWETRCNHYSRRCRRMRAKQTLLRNVNAYAEFMFQSWKEGIDGDEPSSSRGTSWFRQQHAPKGSGKHRNHNQRSNHRFRRDHEFCKDDFDVETVFHSAFGGNRFFYWSFMNEENPQWRKSEGSSNYGKSWNWRRRRENEYGSSTESESDCSDSGLVSDRLALGLNTSGPLNLEDVKNAYRTCALKWHPDRHQGYSKVVAEEKFKHCSAAYQSLCDKLALD